MSATHSASSLSDMETVEPHPAANTASVAITEIHARVPLILQFYAREHNRPGPIANTSHPERPPHPRAHPAKVGISWCPVSGGRLAGCAQRLQTVKHPYIRFDVDALVGIFVERDRRKCSVDDVPP